MYYIEKTGEEIKDYFKSKHLKTVKKQLLSLYLLYSTRNQYPFYKCNKVSDKKLILTDIDGEVVSYEIKKFL